MMWDEYRFSLLNEFLSVEVAAVYIKNAAALKLSKDWSMYPADRKWEAPARILSSGRELKEVVKLYLHSKSFSGRVPNVSAIRFSIPLLDPQDSPQLIEDFVEIRIARKEGVRAVCAPRPISEKCLDIISMSHEEFDAAGKMFWGFGLEHPYKNTFEPHKRIAGPLVDHWRFDSSENQNFEFQPVFLKVLDGDLVFYFMIETDGWEHEVSVTDLNPADAPEDLVSYDLTGKLPKTRCGGGMIASQAPDPFEASAAIRRFVKK